MGLTHWEAASLFLLNSRGVGCCSACSLCSSSSRVFVAHPACNASTLNHAPKADPGCFRCDPASFRFAQY
eukprot:145400-Pelagomonas_calceolata.AAC.7